MVASKASPILFPTCTWQYQQSRQFPDPLSYSCAKSHSESTGVEDMLHFLSRSSRGCSELRSPAEESRRLLGLKQSVEHRVFKGQEDLTWVSGKPSLGLDFSYQQVKSVARDASSSGTHCFPVAACLFQHLKFLPHFP